MPKVLTKVVPLGGVNYAEKSFMKLTPGVNVMKLFPSLLMTRTNKLLCLSLETLSSQALGFEVKARANPIGGPFRCFLLG